MDPRVQFADDLGCALHLAFGGIAFMFFVCLAGPTLAALVHWWWLYNVLTYVRQ